MFLVASRLWPILISLKVSLLIQFLPKCWSTFRSTVHQFGDDGLFVHLEPAPSLLKIFFKAGYIFSIRKKAKSIWRAAPLILFCAIWKEMNRVIFEDSPFSTLRSKLSIIHSLFTWAGCIPNADISFVRVLLYGFYRYDKDVVLVGWFVCFSFRSLPFSCWLLRPFFAYSLYTLFLVNMLLVYRSKTKKKRYTFLIKRIA